MGEDLRPINPNPIESRMREFVTNLYVRITLVERERDKDEHIVPIRLHQLISSIRFTENSPRQFLSKEILHACPSKNLR